MRFRELTEDDKRAIRNVSSYSEALSLSKKFGCNLRTIYKWRSRIKEGYSNINNLGFYINQINKIKEFKFPNRINAEEVSDYFDISISKARQIVSKIQSNENFITKSDPLEIKLKDNLNFKFGLVSDTHLNSIYERLDLLEFAYYDFKRQGITKVFHAGNIIDGFSKLNANKVKNISFDSQIEYLIENYPKIEGITTYFITADEHEIWAPKTIGLNPGPVIERIAKENGRDDLKFIGHIEADVILRSKDSRYLIRIIHPGGASTLSISLKFQKLVDHYIQEQNVPDMLIVGHYHKMIQFRYKGVEIIGAGSFQDQTDFFKKKLIYSNLGYYVVNIKSRNTIIFQKTQFDSLKNQTKTIL